MSDYKHFEEIEVWQDAQNLALSKNRLPLNVAHSVKVISKQLGGFVKNLRSK